MPHPVKSKTVETTAVIVMWTFRQTPVNANVRAVEETWEKFVQPLTSNMVAAVRNHVEMQPIVLPSSRDLEVGCEEIIKTLPRAWMCHALLIIEEIRIHDEEKTNSVQGETLDHLRGRLGVT